ncbi:MAG: hypothetical protein EBT78_16315 [Betaproteobacteria bacterium]|jgi:hypothetical protein|nr:hypothetical protein [Betaproteobacteria bacterium]NBT69313.1 hypothetical protein [Betaproteobacteria bacterium]
MTTASEQLAAAVKAAEEANAKVEALKKQSHAEDLKLAKELIARHGFTQTDLKPELKVGRGTAKRTSTPRKSTRRSKK